MLAAHRTSVGLDLGVVANDPARRASTISAGMIISLPHAVVLYVRSPSMHLARQLTTALMLTYCLITENPPDRTSGQAASHQT
ncbi:hypothetical protein NEUTE1DRAFT_140131 [Neurospora tetrasperma FGSC 2508]|uniref:Uncharacterized protein n=1 Tax=Neurospora tetrasperma (strain FGSC 2508 / ATCC MYA-4615 / P0657) TaxID=510951 RepID=F8MSG2_NEUT8|nr:uncharacterized protein NEUTE1DRAFT_140131 [Neurospora tetrasperma FGSC 2508]EGO55902.1 hypothetical protein NEUTE1DRAFT_140131 [Neurospora tetrasperma FGSC 2508]EGZ68840.1 hypothetical protein NEUTE2DRAFT_168520 [Neurospora tetrasperma FGSC 2509]